MFGLFGSDSDQDDDPGCTAHHYPDDGTTLAHRVTDLYLGEDSPEWRIEKRILLDCQHEGCSNQKTEWTVVEVVEDDEAEAHRRLADILESDQEDP